MERTDHAFEDEATAVEPLFVLGSEPPKSAASFRVMPMPVPARIVTYQEHELLESAAFKERVESIIDEILVKMQRPPISSSLHGPGYSDIVLILLLLVAAIAAILAAAHGF